MSEATVEVSVEHGVARLTLDRPDRRNAVIGPLVDDLTAAVRETRDSSTALLLAGNGRHLCAGLDIDAFNADPPPPWRDSFGVRWATLHTELWNDDRPLVVAHTGGAIGAGSALLFAADVAISGRSAFAHVIEAALGMLAPVNLAWLVARHSHAVAGDLALLAERVGADELHRRGLVAEVVDDSQVLDRALDRARRLASFPPSAVASTRSVLRELGGRDLGELIVAAQRHSTASGPRRTES